MQLQNISISLQYVYTDFGVIVLGMLREQKSSASGRLIKEVAFKAINRPGSPLERAFKIIEPYFEPVIVKAQRYFDSDENLERVLDLFPKEGNHNLIIRKAREAKGSLARWRAIVDMLASAPKRTMYEIYLGLLYPKIDSNVSKHLNHLLKSPFCIHPSTGRVCVPIIDQKTFNPLTAPTMEELYRLMGEKGSNPTAEERMAPYIEFFEKFIAQMG